VLTLSDILGRDSIDVDVLQNVFFADGPVSDLKLSIVPGYGSSATVISGKRVHVVVRQKSQIIPFAVANPDDSSIVSYAFIWVPGLSDALPQINRKAPPLQVRSDGMPQLMAGIKPKAVLAVLLINRDRVVSSAAIAEAIWNDNVPAAYPASLQVFISTLRRSLRDLFDGGNMLISTQAPGYRLTVDSLAVDLGRFEQARTVGNEQFAAKRYVDAAAAYRAALAEWSGPALADLRGYRFADEFAAAVEEDRLATLQARIDADLACGRDAAVIMGPGRPAMPAGAADQDADLVQRGG